MRIKGLEHMSQHQIKIQVQHGAQQQIQHQAKNPYISLFLDTPDQEDGLQQSYPLFRVFVADTFLKRFLGYMFQREPQYPAILITPCNSIHTFFMRFDIDVLFVDENMRVISIVENLKPGKMIMPVKGAIAVIEAKSGGLRKISMGISMGTVLYFSIN